MYCMELEIPNCLPTLNPDDDPAAYIAAYCDQSRIDFANNTQPVSTVLSLSECDDDHRRVRLDNYLAPVHRAAQAVGRDANYPCCAPDDTACTALTPACTRRALGALVTNTSRGELAVADTEAQDTGLSTLGRLENLHSGQPGYGFLPTGLMPEHVRSFSPPGPTGIYGRQESPAAWAVTANTGSCDLSVVSIDKIVKLAERPAICYQRDHQADAQCSTRTCDSDSCPQRVEPWIAGAGNARRPMVSRPSWIEVAPWSDNSRRVVMVAYPTCGLIATVDLGPVGSVGCSPDSGCGRITDAVAFDATGKPRILSAAALASLECAADCGGDSSTSLMPDPKNLPDGGIAGVPVFPATLAVESAGQRVLIGDAVGKSITVVDFNGSAADGSRFIGTPRTIPLDFSVLPESLRGGQPGLDSIRISPRTPAGQFAYVVARDSTVRVIDMDREIECETNPDPRYLRAHAGDFARVLPDELNESNLRRLSCLPVGASATPRAPLAISSGITLSSSSLPRDVGFVHVDAGRCDTTDPLNCPWSPSADISIWLQPSSSLWLGDFAWIMGGGGVATGIQVADYCPGPSYRACFPDAAALKRVAFLHTRSQYLPSPDLLNLPSYFQAQMVSPTDRLMNVKRVNSRFEAQPGLFGPRTDSDGSGIPSFVTRVLGSAVSYFEAVDDPKVTAERRRLLLPAPTPYYYLPVDPVCDIAISSHAKPENFASPDGILPLEPTRRPLSMVQFTDASALTDSIWSLDWEGVLGGLTRTSGRLLGDGTLIDLNGLYCSRGVETGDKVWLTGCQSDTDCFNGSTCHREAAQGFDPGICLTNDQAVQCRALSQQVLVDTGNDTAWAATWLRRYRITRSEQQVTIGTGDTADRLILDEIPEPEYEIERQSCTTLGDSCSGTILLPGRTVDVSKPSPKLTCRGVGNVGGTLEKSCILECKANVDCGVGFVCAHSRYEEDEVKAGFSSAGSRPRCVHAPLIHPRTPMRKGNSWQPMGISAANALLAACYPDLSNYEVHSGDSFLVHGDRTGAPSLVQRAADGSCQRPPAGAPSYGVSRLMEPRLRIGPHDALTDMDPQRCPSGGPGWLSHRVPAIPEAVAQPSCQALRPPSKGGVRTIQLQGSMNGTLDLVRGEDFPLPTTSATDPWLASEFELFSGLPLDGGRNQCILTNANDERYPTSDEANGCSGFCRFPGDHTELGGVRRIHFENPLGNIVMRIPRVLRDFTKPYSDCHDLSRGAPTAATCSCKAFDPVTKLCAEDSILSWNEAVWSVPPDGYSVTFGVTGALTTYALPVQTAQRDISSGMLAQGLKSVTAGPSPYLYIVDEGRTGQLSGLRGQVMRIRGSSVDASFLLR